MREVRRILDTLRPRRDEVLVDFGCGADARFLVEAVRRYGCSGIGIEIDEERASSAKRAIEAVGLSKNIKIVHGDATKTNVDADVGVAYLFPRTLAELRPQIQRLRAFASYRHAIPGLSTTRIGDAYVWRRSDVERRPQVAVWEGQYYTAPWCNNPNCRMCNSIRRQLYWR